MKEGSTYRMWYSKGTGLGINHVRIYQATSSNGITWDHDPAVLLESNSDVIVSGAGTPGANGTYKLVGESIADLTNEKAAFKLESADWWLWYDSANGDYRLSNALGGDGTSSWIKTDDNTKIDGSYSPHSGGATGNPAATIAWDSEKIETPVVIKVASTYHLYYSGFKIGDGPGQYQMGHATSNDGTSWTKDENNPIITYQMTDADQLNYYQVAEPGVYYNASDSKFYLYYTTMTSRPGGYSSPFNLQQVIALSISSDGSGFTLHGAAMTQSSNYLVADGYFGYSTPYVMKASDGLYHMFYDVVTYDPDWKQVALAHATSTDGLTFSEVEYNIFIKGQGDWKTHEVRAPAVIEENGVFKMYFAGNNDLIFQSGWIFWNWVCNKGCNLPLKNKVSVS